MTQRTRRGFTLVEVILAMTIAVMLIVAVQSATQAMSRSARMQTEAAASEARFQRFVEIMRRDVRGWLPAQGNGAPTRVSKPGADQVLLTFSTTADSLSAALSAPSASDSCLPRSVGNLRYVLRQSSMGFEVIRMEFSHQSGLPPSEITVWRGRVVPTFEFFQAKTWVSEWQGTDRPQCIRVTLDSERVVFSF